MKITLSRTQWNQIGKAAGWTKTVVADEALGFDDEEKKRLEPFKIMPRVTINGFIFSQKSVVKHVHDEIRSEGGDPSWNGDWRAERVSGGFIVIFESGTGGWEKHKVSEAEMVGEAQSYERTYGEGSWNKRMDRTVNKTEPASKIPYTRNWD